MFQSWKDRSAPKLAPSIPESLPAASEPTQSSSDIHGVTPSPMAPKPVQATPHPKICLSWRCGPS